MQAKSTTKQAKALIRREIKHFYGTQVTGTNKPAIVIMREDADNYNGGRLPRFCLTNWAKGSALVDAGCFRIYTDDQREFLRKIYGDSVNAWSGTKCHRVYASLIGREYAYLVRHMKARA